MNYEAAIQRLEEIQDFQELDVTKPLSIPDLINAEGYFTQLHSYYSEKTVADYNTYLKAEKTRKRAFNEALLKHSEGSSVAAAKPRAENDVEKEVDAEIEANSNYMLSKYRRESIKETLAFLRQKISYEKQELERAQFISGNDKK